MEDRVPPEPSLPPRRRRPITGTKRRRHRHGRHRQGRPQPPPTATDWLNHHTDPQHKGDLSSTLEHLMAVGLKEQRDAQRYHQAVGVGPSLPGQQREDPIPLPPPTVHRQGDHGSENDNNNDGDDVEEEEGTTTTTRTRGNKLSALKEAFVEDIRLYGETSETFKYDGLERSPWPCSKRVRSAAAATTGGTTTTTSKVGSLPRKNLTMMDEPWELEYGDSIHPLAFSSARLSSTQFTTTTLLSAEECDAINGTNLNVATTETSLSEKEVPRALLLRCWQRAVDAASQGALVTVGVDAMERITNTTTTTTNLGEAEQDVSSRHLFGGSILGLVDSTLDHTAGPSIPPPRAVKEPPFAAAQRVLAQDTFRTKRKCTSMGLGLTRAQLPMDVSKGTCPACYRQFAQLKELQHHYFGDRDQRGCCWRRIAQKEPRIVANVLENHVKSQIDQLLGLIMDQAFQTVAQNGGDDDSTSRKTLFTWYDILKFTEEAVVHSSSHSVETSTTTDPRNGIHPMFETFQRTSDSDYPLVLNPTVLRNARKRLMDRYANVPL